MVPTVRAEMSPIRHSLAPSASLAEARALVAAEGVRHVPVLDAAEVVGIVTLSDLFVLDAVVGIDPETARIADVMSRELLVVAPDTPIAEVARAMHTRRVGSALVVDGGALVGVFTASDAVRVLASLA